MRLAMRVVILGLSLSAVMLQAPEIVEADELSFARALELTEERSEILMLQESAVRSAGMVLAEARSRLGPQLTFQASGGYMAFPPEGVTVRAGELGTILLDSGPPPISYAIPEEDLVFIEDARSGYFELSLQLSQPLYTWGKLQSSVQLAGLGLEASKMEYTERKRRLRQDLHTAYFSGVLAGDSLGLLQQILDILEGIEEDRKRAFELGSVNRLSVLEIQTQISEVQRRIVQAGEAYASALEAIAVYTDLDPENMDLSTGFRREHAVFCETQLKEKALESSAALKKARLEQEQARENLQLIRGGANLRPDISFNLSFELSGQTVPWSESGWEEAWDLNLIAGVGTRGTLFDAGRSRHQLRQAGEALEASQLAIDLLRKQVRLQTRRAVEAMQLRRAELQEAVAAVAQAEEEEKNASRAFEQQLLTRERWGLTRIALLLKKLALVEGEYRLELALYELESLAGFP
jgi:outer membrane protein TolC